MESVKIVIVGPHNSGRSTLASLIKMFLEETGYTNVSLSDTDSLPDASKEEFFKRWFKNKNRPVQLTVVEPNEYISKEQLTAGLKAAQKRANPNCTNPVCDGCCKACPL